MPTPRISSKPYLWVLYISLCFFGMVNQAQAVAFTIRTLAIGQTVKVQDEAVRNATANEIIIRIGYFDTTGTTLESIETDVISENWPFLPGGRFRDLHDLPGVSTIIPNQPRGYYSTTATGTIPSQTGYSGITNAIVPAGVQLYVIFQDSDVHSIPRRYAVIRDRNWSVVQEAVISMTQTLSLTNAQLDASDFLAGYEGASGGIILETSLRNETGLDSIPLLRGHLESPFDYQLTGWMSEPYEISVSGLPPGLSFNSTTNHITGIPTVMGAFSIAASVVGAGPQQQTTLIVGPSLRQAIGPNVGVWTTSSVDSLAWKPQTDSFDVAADRSRFLSSVSSGVAPRQPISLTLTGPGRINWRVGYDRTANSGPLFTNPFSAQIDGIPVNTLLTEWFESAGQKYGLKWGVWVPAGVRTVTWDVLPSAQTAGGANFQRSLGEVSFMPGTLYQDWATTALPLNHQGANQDPDGDGVSNLEEYAYGMNPLARDEIPFSMQHKENGEIDAVWQLRPGAAAALLPTVLRSHNLKFWSPWFEENPSLTPTELRVPLCSTDDLSLPGDPNLCFVRLIWASQ